MLKDEYERLLKLFQEGAEGKSINLGDVFSQSLTFFQQLKAQIEKGSPEEKKEAMGMMSEMYQQMMLETQKITKRSGLSEDQLVDYAENPANFTPEQWKAIQESKEKILHAGEDLAKTLGKMGRDQPEEKEAGGKQPKEKKGKKSNWMKS